MLKVLAIAAGMLCVAASASAQTAAIGPAGPAPGGSSISGVPGAGLGSYPGAVIPPGGATSTGLNGAGAVSNMPSGTPMATSGAPATAGSVSGSTGFVGAPSASGANPAGPATSAAGAATATPAGPH